MSLYIVQTQRMYNTKSEPQLDYGLPVRMMCECGFTDCNKYTLWCGMSIMGEVGGGRVDKNSVLSAQFFCEPKTALKNTVY